MKFPLEEVLRLQKEFTDLYHQTGLIAVHPDHVQVTAKCLAELSDVKQWKNSFRGQEFTHYFVMIEGLKFLACLDYDEVDRYQHGASK